MCASGVMNRVTRKINNYIDYHRMNNVTEKSTRVAQQIGFRDPLPEGNSHVTVLKTNVY